jgi:hypothetical protein
MAAASRLSPGFCPRGYRFATLDSGAFYTVAEYVEPGMPVDLLTDETLHRTGGWLADVFLRISSASVGRPLAIPGRLSWRRGTGLVCDGTGSSLSKLVTAIALLRPVWPRLTELLGPEVTRPLGENVRVALALLQQDPEPLTYVNTDLNIAHFAFAGDGTARLFDPLISVGHRGAAVAQCVFAFGHLWPLVHLALEQPQPRIAASLRTMAAGYLEGLSHALSAEQRLRVSAYTFVELLDRSRGFLAYRAGRVTDRQAREACAPGISFDAFSAAVLQALFTFRITDGNPAVELR